jgi:hypothetical protein
VIVGTTLAGILLHTASPFGLDESEYSGPRTGVFVVLAVNYLPALVCFLKGKPILGAVGLLVPFVSVVGAARLATPRSPGHGGSTTPTEARTASVASAPTSTSVLAGDSTSAGRVGSSGRSTT